MKKARFKQVWEFLVEKGYVEEKTIEGITSKMPTELGISKGIKTVDKSSAKGYPYTVIMYPETVQKEIVEFLMQISETRQYETDAEPDRIGYNRKMNRPDGAGASWTTEEDEQLDREYTSGMQIADIARAHDRTKGAIFARLRKHGLIT